jgi:hypothetical protein
MNNQSVAVVSSNNSATKNVFEKLESNGVSFIAALLGSSQNKKNLSMLRLKSRIYQILD